MITPALAQELETLCPFGAISFGGGVLDIGAGCKMCRLCARHGSGAITFVPDSDTPVDLSGWQGIAVFAQQRGSGLHPVSFELLGKARQLADKAEQPVYALCVGHGLGAAAQALAQDGADRVFVYDHPALAAFDPEKYTACIKDFSDCIKPSVIMVGATALGRCLAPRAAARCRTGLTADCTLLDISDGALVQTRPAFGGNIMAQIVTPRHRPQFCTVRYRVFDAPSGTAAATGQIIARPLPPGALASGTQVLSVGQRPAEEDISEAEYIVAVGRGMSDSRGISLAGRLAAMLGAQLACTRPLVEAGLFDPRRQIGLSGRTVKPRLIITLGISGAVQFAAGMGGADKIIAINQDKASPIFGIAHTCLVGDAYEIIEELLAKGRVSHTC